MLVKSRLVLAVLAVMATMITYAGGWSVLTLDEWPGTVVVSEPVEMKFTLRAHGRTPVDGVDLEIVATHTASGGEIVFTAMGLERGKYSTTLTLPKSGVWQWRAEGYGEHALPDIEVISPESETTPASPEQLGAELFLAKGCATCHASGLVQVNGVPIPVLPSASGYVADPAFLRAWLADPQAVRASAMMPNLDLRAAEIEALITFLRGESSITQRK